LDNPTRHLVPTREVNISHSTASFKKVFVCIESFFPPLPKDINHHITCRCLEDKQNPTITVSTSVKES